MIVFATFVTNINRHLTKLVQKLMKSALHIILLSITLVVTTRTMATSVDKTTDCPFIKIEVERLPDLNVPRSGHSVFVVNGEVTVVGGHTSGFVPTATAEYYKDGEWHLLKTVYIHDGGFSVAMKSGKVLIAGGFKDNLGIGQSYEVEMYDPDTHSFKGFGCLDQKRASAAAVELDSGKVLIVGNWHADDGMEIFDGEVSFTHMKDVSQTRCLPHVFRTSNNDAVIVAGYDTHGDQIGTPIVDRLRGDAFNASLFETWRPLKYDLALHSDDSFIGDEAKGIYAYLMPVKNESGQVAIVEVRDTVFSPLSTVCPVPMNGIGGQIQYISPVFVDRLRQRGYIVGFDDSNRLYALCIDYAKSPAPLTLYHTDPLPDAALMTIPILTQDGDLMLTGGVSPVPNGNFSSSAQVWLLRFNNETRVASGDATSAWLWGGITLLILILVGFFVMAKFKRYRKDPLEVSEKESLDATPVRGDEQLMQRICQLMEEQQLFLRSGLKVSDIAVALGTNSRYVSDCIKAIKGCPFLQFVNDYRMDYAKELMRKYPDKKISAVAMESGFSNDKALTRYFKEHTGMTPTEWKNNDQK